MWFVFFFLVFAQIYCLDLSSNAHVLHCLCTACEHAKCTLSSASQTSNKSTYSLRMLISTPPLLMPTLKNSAKIPSKVLLILMRKSSATIWSTS